MKILRASDWMVPIEAQKKAGGIGKTPTVRIGMTMKQMMELVGKFSDSPHFHPDKRICIDRLEGELNGKAGGYHSSFHLPMTFAYEDIMEFDSSDDHTGKHEPGFYLQNYTWGYNYRTERRVTKYERGRDGSTLGLEGNPVSGRFTLSLILYHGQPLDEEVPYLYELLRDWIIDGAENPMGKHEFKPIDWNSEEYPWNWKESSNEDEVEA